MKKTFSKTLIIISAVLLLLLFFRLTGISQPLIGVFQKILAPVQDLTYNLSQKINSIFKSQSLAALKQENQELKEKLKQSLIDQVEFSRLAQENEFLGQELNFLETQNYNYQIAKIIGKETLLGKKILTLDKGLENNIEPGCPIIISAENKNHGYLIGKIIKTENNTSQALFITDSRSSIAAKINGAKTTAGLVKGERGLTLKMDLIPFDQEIKKGDLIITSGLENKIPEGLIIGEVTEITSQPGDFFQSAKINSFVDFETLKIVTILLP